MAELYRYAAFISYASADAVFARRLHRALEGYGIPAQLGSFDLIGGGGKKNRIYPVFRDREEAAAGELKEEIEAALKASGALIVVCSPAAAASAWVDKEIAFFKALGRGSRVFAIIASTAPSTDSDGRDATPRCFPRTLSDGSSEPLAADARPGKDGFRSAWLKIVAGLISVSPGQLIDRDRKRQRTRLIGRAAGVAAGLVAIVAAASGVYEASMRSAMLAQARFLIRGASVDERLPAVFSMFAAPGSPLTAAPFAVAAVPPPGALLPSDDRATRALLETGLALPHLARMGFGTDVQFSRNGERVIALVATRPEGLIGRGFERAGNVAVAQPSPAQRLQAWDARTGKLVLAMADEISLTRARPLFGGREITGLYLSDDGKRLAVITQGARASLWDLAAGRKIADLGERVVSLTPSPDGARLAVGHDGGDTVVVETAGGREVVTLPVRSVKHAAFSADSAFFSAGGDDGFALWDMRSGRQIATQRGIQIESIEFSAGAVAFAGRRNVRFAMVVLTLPNGRAAPDLALEDQLGLQSEIVADGTRIVATTSDGGVFRIFDVARRVTMISAQVGELPELHWRAGGDRIALALSSGATEIWDVRTAKKLASVAAPQPGVRGHPALSEDGRRLLVTYDEGPAHLIAMEDGRVLRSWRAGSSIVFVPGSGNLSVTDAAGEGWFVDGATGQDKFRLGRLYQSQNAFGPQAGLEQPPVVQIGARLVTILPDGSGALRDAETGEAIVSLFGSSARPAVVPVGDGLRFATQSDEGLALWDTASGKRIAILGGTRSAAVGAMSVDGRSMVLVSSDGMHLVEAGATDDLMPAGVSLRERVCRVNRDYVSPFPAAAREKGELSALLVGRPWRPCDWRGLGAIFPDAEAGDGWFEGSRQWLRLNAVRLGLAEDYRPDERR